ncbi:TPA: hypothetical protein TX926_000562 [Streptococcus suis]|nr:hypothetical protein [Streptococcus suis]
MKFCRQVGQLDGLSFSVIEEREQRMAKYMVIVEGQFVLHCKNKNQNHESYRLTPYNFEDIGHTRYFNLETAELLAKLFNGTIAIAAEATLTKGERIESLDSLLLRINANPNPVNTFLDTCTKAYLGITQ